MSKRNIKTKPFAKSLMNCKGGVILNRKDRHRNNNSKYGQRELKRMINGE